MKRWATFACALLASQALAAAEPAREEFAYEAAVAGEAPAAVLRAPLTLDVYRAVSRPDLGDIRAFNAAGELLAHSIERTPAETTSSSMPLSFFPVAAPADTGLEQHIYQVQQNAQGAILSVQTRAARSDERSVYLVDASQIEAPIVALDVAWKEASVEFVGTMIVEGSQDLKTWHAITQGALANLSRDGGALRVERIELPVRHVPRYLRLSWANPDDAARVHLTAIRAQIQNVILPERDWLELSTTPGQEQGEYRLEPGGMMPIDRVRIVLPANTVARVEVLSRARDGDPWVKRAEKTVFSVESTGAQVKDNELAVGRTVGQQWLLRVGRQANGIGGQTPRVELGWIADHIVILTRGEPPYAVAFGRALTAPADFGVDELVRRSQRDGADRVEIVPAKLGSARALRGDDARVVAWYQQDWKRWFLWSVLILGVALLGAFAARLMRHAQQ